MTKRNDGYLIVASRKYIFYAWACNLAEGIKDYYPEAQICIVTEERFCEDGRAAEVADHLIHCDNHYRAKLWGMSQSPFDRTMYIDADMEIWGEGIETCFDELGDNDMMFTGLPDDHWYVFNDEKFKGGEFKYCGAVCLYNSASAKVMEFMSEWYELYVKQYAGEWWPLNEEGEHDYENFPKRLQIWDQFTLMWLTAHTDKYADLKVEHFENGLKWNYWALFDRIRTPPPEDAVLLHLSCQGDKKLFG